MLRAEDVSVSFAGGARVLDEVTLGLAAGRKTCVIGETGSGKSMLLLTILGLLGPGAAVSGRILMDGLDLLRLSPRELRKARKERLSYIPQGSGNGLNPLYTAGSQLTELIRFHREVPQGEAVSLAGSLLAQAGLDDPFRVMASYPFQLSGGMRQRVLAAMGLSGEAPILLVDEPTKGLDRARIDLMAALFRGIEGKSMLCVTHDLRFARQVADSVAVLYSSELIEEGSCGEFYSGPLHPYSRAMLAALPENGLKAEAGFAPPRSGKVAAGGCAFASRCREAVPRCLRGRPPLIAAGNRRVRCWKHAPEP
ncbi:MAG: ABC transporter ATP-binding protein [Deltaproteobacteria bacterium]|jgi:peptide/nickel transport system ATP-binding protein|nr:ABC transporter ATP-binding protein [Deltaproteobacteria bacterium]